MRTDRETDVLRPAHGRPVGLAAQTLKPLERIRTGDPTDGIPDRALAHTSGVPYIRQISSDSHANAVVQRCRDRGLDARSWEQSADERG
jgi:hypothetical protein